MAAKKATGDLKGRVRVSVTFPDRNYADLQRIANNKRVSVAWVVRDAVEQYLLAQAPLFRPPA